MIRFILAVTTLLTLCGLTVAQNCGDHGIKRQDEPARISPQQGDCSGGFTISYNGFEIEASDSAQCPEWTTFVPSRHIPAPEISMPGYEPREAGKVFETKQNYKCVRCGFLWLSKCCERDGPETQVGKGFQNWELARCAVIVEGEVQEGTGGDELK